MNNSDDATGATPAYILGHSDREIDRLSVQARLLEPITRDFFCEAGIAPGMHVLDVGSGAGDVVFLVADLVGATGSVIGTDKASAAVVAATAKARGLSNVFFREGDSIEMAFDRPFDAVVGRYVLLHQHDPGVTLRKLAARLRPAGLMLFHELDWMSARSIPPAPLYDRCCRWIGEAFGYAGAHTEMAGKLHAAFVAAGLPTPKMLMRTFVGGGDEAFVFLQALADLIGAVLPAMEQAGIATAAKIAPATLAEHLRREMTANGGMIIGRSEIAAWARA